VKIIVVGFDRVLRTRSRLALSGGLLRPESKSFDRPFGRLTVLSKVEGLRTLSEAEGPSGGLFVKYAQLHE